MNRKPRPDIETLFLISDYRWLYISSTIVKTVVKPWRCAACPDQVLTLARALRIHAVGEDRTRYRRCPPGTSELARLQELEASLDRDTDK